MPAQRPARKAITNRPYYRHSPHSGDEATPSLVSVDDANDRSSAFEIETPTKSIKAQTIKHRGQSDDGSEYEIETPTKSTKTKAIRYYEPSDDGSEYELKPDVSDEDGDIKPKLKSPKGKARTKAKAGSGRKGTTGSSGNVSASGGSPKKLGQAWTGEEDWALFQYLHPKIKPDWKTAASVVGRDAKVSSSPPKINALHSYITELMSGEGLSE